MDPQEQKLKKLLIRAAVEYILSELPEGWVYGSEPDTIIKINPYGAFPYYPVGHRLNWPSEIKIK